ncbi:MAG: cell division protein FtsA [Patescibacteria group bacterium]
MASPKKHIAVGVDIGNSNVITVVTTQDPETNDVMILGFGDVQSAGMRRGMVVDIDEVIAAISNSLEEAERMAGIPIDRAVVSISGQHVHSSNSRGVVAVSRSTGEIAKEDIDRVIEAAKAFSMPANREVIHILPRFFIVDGESGIKDPLGMKGIRLEVDAHVITASSPVVKNLLKCAYQAGADVEELVLASLACSKVILSRKQKEAGVVLIDIGGSSTEIAVFEEGEVLHTHSIPLGGTTITNDIAVCLRTSIETAEKVKIEYGSAFPTVASEKEILELAHLDPMLEGQEISRKYILEIINARLEEIFTMVKDELRRIGRDGLLPAGAVITGGGSRIDGIVDVARESLRLPAQVGSILTSLNSIDKDMVANPSFATAIGLAIWGLEEHKAENFMKGMFDQVKGKGFSDMFKNIMKKR